VHCPPIDHIRLSILTEGLANTPQMIRPDLRCGSHHDPLPQSRIAVSTGVAALELQIHLALVRDEPPLEPLAVDRHMVGDALRNGDPHGVGREHQRPCWLKAKKTAARSG
jgi:hypothetical protein